MIFRSEAAPPPAGVDLHPKETKSLDHEGGAEGREGGPPAACRRLLVAWSEGGGNVGDAPTHYSSIHEEEALTKEISIAQRPLEDNQDDAKVQENYVGGVF